MDNINSLSGVEFENLCQVLLQKQGFDVETTKQSGDGGIDLIAYNRQPFYSGKYIVQCKRYIGSVGEPVVRDLYGVIMAEHANKGILITTGHFTVSASRFAQNKNLELIDGEALAVILAKCGMAERSIASQLSHFTQYQCFDKPKYDFYKNMISQNICTVEMGSDFLFNFLFDYLAIPHKTDEMNDMIHSGLSEDFLRLFEWYTGKYYKKGKEKVQRLEELVRQYKGLAQIYNFDLFEYVQNRYEVLTNDMKSPEYSICYRSDDDYYRNGEKHFSWFHLWNWDDDYYQDTKSYIVQNLNNENRVKFDEESNFFEIMNLLSLFHYFGIQAGIDRINKMLFGYFPELITWVQSQHVYKDAIKSFVISYKDSNDRTGENDYCINMTTYFDRFRVIEEDRLSMEIEKINNMLSVL